MKSIRSISSTRTKQTLFFSLFCLLLSGCSSGSSSSDPSPTPASVAAATGASSYSVGQITIVSNQSLTTSSVILTLQTDGSLVAYSAAGVLLWTSNTPGHACATNCTAVFQTDGNLVLSLNGVSYWSTSTSGLGTNLILSQYHPILQITNSSGSPVWTSDSTTNTTVTPTTTTTNASSSYTAGQFTLSPNQSVTLTNLTLTYQADGNLVATDSSANVVWNSGTSGKNCASNCTAVFQGDGNLVLSSNSVPYWSTATAGMGSSLLIRNISPYLIITNSAGGAVWNSNVAGQATTGLANYQLFALNQLNLTPNQSVQLNGYQLVYQTDGNLVAYNSAGGALWSTGTGGRACDGSCQAIFQGDGNLVLYQNGSAYWSSNTAGIGATLYVLNQPPYIGILNGYNQWAWYP